MFTDELIQNIRKLFKDNKSVTYISNAFNISRNSVKKYVDEKQSKEIYLKQCERRLKQHQNNYFKKEKRHVCRSCGRAILTKTCVACFCENEKRKLKKDKKDKNEEENFNLDELKLKLRPRELKRYELLKSIRKKYYPFFLSQLPEDYKRDLDEAFKRVDRLKKV